MLGVELVQCHPPPRSLVGHVEYSKYTKRNSCCEPAGPSARVPLPPSPNLHSSSNGWRDLNRLGINPSTCLPGPTHSPPMTSGKSDAAISESPTLPRCEPGPTPYLNVQSRARRPWLDQTPMCSPKSGKTVNSAVHLQRSKLHFHRNSCFPRTTHMVPSGNHAPTLTPRFHMGCLTTAVT